jgi:hypothetical protein
MIKRIPNIDYVYLYNSKEILEILSSKMRENSFRWGLDESHYKLVIPWTLRF